LLQNVGGRMVHPSPVRNLEHVETAFLIIHREEDPQIPVAQAVVLLRGLKAAVEVF
jgi:dipeptidyl aminopeptidase/acylaminoacyl peptidase